MRTPSSKPRLIAGYLLWFIAGTVITTLVLELSSSRFQQHVRVFYPSTVCQSGAMHLIASIGSTALPVALVGPALGPAYYCLRNRLPLSYLMKATSIAVVIGLLLSSGHVQGMPDQPFRRVIPTCVFFSTLFALAVQIMLEDWTIVNDTST